MASFASYVTPRKLPTGVLPRSTPFPEAPAALAKELEAEDARCKTPSPIPEGSPADASISEGQSPLQNEPSAVLSDRGTSDAGTASAQHTNNNSMVSLTNEEGIQVAILQVPTVEEAARPAPSLLAAALTKPQGASPGGMGRMKMKDIRVFCNFITPGKRHSYSLRIPPTATGNDVVEATLRAMLADPKLEKLYSADPNQYKLYASDETGDFEGLIGRDGRCQFDEMALDPLKGAKLSAAPQRTELRPLTLEDVMLTVSVQSRKGRSAITVTVAPDVRFGSLLTVLCRRLSIQRNATEESLRNPNNTNPRGLPRLAAMVGATEVIGPQVFNFGFGCGNDGVPLNNRTLQSLQRFGVQEVVLHVPDDATNASQLLVTGDLADTVANPTRQVAIKRAMDEEEARTYREFEVVKINKYGVKQERVLGVDGERIYNMRPKGDYAKTRHPERAIADIADLKDHGPSRPAYLEINYKRTSGYDTDKIECRNSAECEELLEKLRVLKRLSDRKQEAATEEKKPLRRMTSFLGKAFGMNHTAGSATSSPQGRGSS